MIGLEWFLLVSVITALAVMVFVHFKLSKLTKQGLDEQGTKAMMNQVYGELSNKILAQTKSVLETDKEAIFKDNKHSKEVIERLVTDLKTEIDARQKEIRSLEQDRNTKFGEITRAISEHRKITEALSVSTQSLAQILSNNQVRGQWGERIIEDILQSAGLIESIHYERQKALSKNGSIPDITLLLPNKRKVAIDVKFPYAQVQLMVNAPDAATKRNYLKLFEKDVKEKILQLDKRGYINLEAGTLDYAILFVPNEQLFSYINQQFPHLIDEAMNKKIMIVSPFTFLIVARTVMEAYRNFMIENNLRTIIDHINHFVTEWDRFKLDFDKFDVSLAKLRDHFDQIHTTRYKQMDLRLRRVREYEQLNPAMKPTELETIKIVE
jgi:DNA recombination protein RmuC